MGAQLIGTSVLPSAFWVPFHPAVAVHHCSSATSSASQIGQQTGAQKATAKNGEQQQPAAGNGQKPEGLFGQAKVTQTLEGQWTNQRQREWIGHIIHSYYRNPLIACCCCWFFLHLDWMSKAKLALSGEFLVLFRKALGDQSGKCCPFQRF